jgi:hypothetical protein
MMMSSVHHLGDAVLMAPHRAKQARDPFSGAGTRESSARPGRGPTADSHVGGGGDPALRSTSRHTLIAKS